MSVAPGRRLFAACVVALVVLHVWPPAPGADVVLWGWLPWDLAYHVGWMIAAAVLVHWMTSSFWPAGDEGDA